MLALRQACADVRDQGIEILGGSGSDASVDSSVQPQEGDDILEIAFDFGGHGDASALADHVSNVLPGSEYV